jgi:AraC family transcriptional regulator, dual regulator of chb operon
MIFMRMEEIPVIISDNYHIDPETDFHYSFISGIPRYRSYHRHDFFEVVLVTRGSMYHLIKDEKHVLHEGMLVFIRPEDYHYYSKIGGGTCEFINLSFSALIFNTLVKYLGEDLDPDLLLSPRLPPVVMLSNDHLEALHKRIDMMNTYFSKIEIKAEFRVVIADILSCFFHERSMKIPAHYPVWFHHFCSKMHKKEYFTQDISVLYRSVDLSREHISREFKKYLGKTPSAYLNDIRLNYAARLLTHSDNPIIEIAMDAGYDNLSHFYHLFKQKYNISPGTFRRTYQRMNVSNGLASERETQQGK